MVEGAGAGHVGLFVGAGADPRGLPLGYAGVRAEGFDQVVGGPGRNAVDAGFRDHGVEGLVDPASAFEQAGEEAPCPQLGIESSRPPAWAAAALSRCPLRQPVQDSVRSRPTLRRSPQWPRPRSVPAAGARRPGGRAQGRLLIVTGQLLRIALGGTSAQLVNAGHPWPYRLRDGTVTELALAVNMPFGVPIQGAYRAEPRPAPRRSAPAPHGRHAGTRGRSRRPARPALQDRRRPPPRSRMPRRRGIRRLRRPAAQGRRHRPMPRLARPQATTSMTI